MPLSEREQQILEDIEKHLQEQDPKFAQEVSTKRVPAAFSNIKVGLALFAIGFIGLIGFFVTAEVAVGVLAFALMLGGGAIFANSLVQSVVQVGRKARPRPPVQNIFGRIDDRFRDMRKKRGEQ